MMVLQYSVVILVCFFGAALQATIGFGFPIVAMIFFSYVFPLPAATTICQSAGIVGVGYIFFKYIKQVQWRTLTPFLITALITGVIFTWATGYLPVAGMKVYMGAVLCIIAMFMLFAASKVKLRPTMLSGCSMGLLSGAMNGLFAIGGPPVALYLLPAINDKIAYLASANAYFFLFKIFNLPIRFMNGSVGKEHVGFILTAIIFMTLGTVVGERIMLRVNRKLFQKLVYTFVLLSGTIIVIQEVL